MTWNSMRLVNQMSFWRVLIMLMRPSLEFQSVLLMGKDFQSVMPKHNFLYKLWLDQLHMGAFYLHLLDFTFIYQFYSWMTTLVKSTFWNAVCLQIISKYFVKVGYLKKESSFHLLPISLPRGSFTNYVYKTR